MTEQDHKPFEPAGHESRWKTIYTMLERHDVDDVITYEEIAAALDVNPRTERRLIYGAVGRAGEQYLDTHQRALISVPNIGYRIVTPTEHLQLARDHNKKAGREIERGYKVATQVDLNDVEPTTKVALEQLAMGLSQQAEINKRQRRANARLAKVMENTVVKVERTSEQVDEVLDRLGKLEDRLRRRDAQLSATEAAGDDLPEGDDI